MSQRGCGFKELEDCLLCNAYLLHSTDAIVGAYQRNVDMWKKNQTTFNHEVVDKNHLSHRTVKSLECRWEKISHACTLYGSCLTAVEERNQSGSNEQDIINQALALFKIKDPKHLDFKFTQCWEILKNYPKWAQPENNQDGNSPLEHGTLISLDSSQLEGTPQDGIWPGSEGRGSGRDATKSKRRVASEKDPMWEEIKNDNSKTHTILEQQSIAFNNAHQARMDLEQQKLDHKYARKQQKMDMKAATINAEILSKNLADMTPFSKEYWTNKKQAIVNSSIERPRASTNLDFGADGNGGSNSGSQFSPNNFDAHNNNTQYVPRSQNVAYFPDLNDINANNGGFEDQYGQWRQQ